MHLLRQVCLAFVFLAVTCQAVQKDGSDMLPRVKLAVDDAEVVKAAKVRALHCVTPVIFEWRSLCPITACLADTPPFLLFIVCC
jgi:hypothetical protein